ncbi:FKBP-type peptidyl-prolyl cis-trans isomerase [Candidatus Parvarchaeota archaeon]|nr:FKBP-type peptidyl-prolyl cis-trans isomerase [Candidatus Parvarchaeota archaeon]
MITENDFVLINFVGRIASTGKIFDLTDKIIAEKEGVKLEGQDFSPVLVIPQAKYILEPISKSLIGKNVGDRYSINIKARDAFGDFNNKLVKTIGMSSFRQNKINPEPGDVVMLDNMMATVLSVSGGRVMVNFNHPLAGKDLVYDIEVVAILEDVKQKYSWIFKHYAGKQPKDVVMEDNKVTIISSEPVKSYVSDAIIADIGKYVNKDVKIEISA